MAHKDNDERLAELAERFAKARDGRTGRSVRAYPDELWREVAALSRAGIPKSELCRRCGFSEGTLANALGRQMARAKKGTERLRSRAQAARSLVRTLQVEVPVPRPARTCEVVFPNGVIVRLDVEGLDDALLGRIRAC